MRPSETPPEMDRRSSLEVDNEKPDEEFIGFRWDLQSQNWYWANVNKEELGLAMQNQPTGTFAVRNASTPNDYTLTVRVNNTNKLIRIYVVNDKVGFTPKTLDFDSVVDLVEYYRNCSLEEHNSTLTTSLKFPLARASQTERAVSENQAKDNMAIPDHIQGRLDVVNQMESESDEKRLAVKFILHHFMESIVAEMLRAERRHNQILSQIEALEREQKNHEKAMLGYNNVQNLLETNQIALQEHLDMIDDDNVRQTVGTNNILQNKRLKSVSEMKDRLKISLEGIERIKNGLKIEDAVMLKRAEIIKERCKRYISELGPYGFDKAFIEKKTNYIQLAMEKESEKLLQNMLKVNLVTSPFDWLTRNPDKKYANDLVQKSLSLLKKRGVSNTNGVFLIRPSASKPGYFALVISMNEVVYNCLIEYRAPKAKGESCGYAFLNTNLFYTTLADFIRYYSLVTLCEHNRNLNTVLRIPVLKYLASVKKRQQAGSQSVDEEEAQLISGLKNDLSNCHSFDNSHPQLEES